MYRNGVVHERGEDTLLKSQRMILKPQKRLQIEVRRIYFLQEYKHLFNCHWRKLWYFPGRYKKLCVGEVTVTKNVENRSKI